MSEPQIFVGGEMGFHNRDLKRAQERLKKGKQYRDLSTVCVIPTRGMIPARVCESWMGLLVPMNNPFVRIFVRFVHEVSWSYLDAQWREMNKLDHYQTTVDFEITTVDAIGLSADFMSRNAETQGFARLHYWNVIPDLRALLKSRKPSGGKE